MRRVGLGDCSSSFALIGDVEFGFCLVYHAVRNAANGASRLRANRTEPFQFRREAKERIVDLINAVLIFLLVLWAQLWTAVRHGCLTFWVFAFLHWASLHGLWWVCAPADL